MITWYMLVRMNMFGVFLACLYILYLSDWWFVSESAVFSAHKALDCRRMKVKPVDYPSVSHLIIFHPHFSCYSSRPAASWPLAMSRPARLPTLIFRRSGAAVWKEAQHLQFTKYTRHLTQMKIKTENMFQKLIQNGNSNINTLHKYINI